MRVLLAALDDEKPRLLSALLDAALRLVPLDLEIVAARTPAELLYRAHLGLDDVALLDWSLAGAGSADLVRELARINPHLRTIAILPDDACQHRQHLWEAGVCSSIPWERLDPEWLSGALCLVDRAMLWEERMRESSAAPQRGFTRGTTSSASWATMPVGYG